MVPPPPQAGDIPLPPAPQDLPVLADVVSAKRYKRKVELATANHLPNEPTPNDVARAEIYKSQVVLAHSAGDAAPPWFLPALNEALTAHFTPLKVDIAKMRNMQLGDGELFPYSIVPFPDGTMPNLPPHNLPPLTSAAAITGLNPGQLNAYCNGYVGVGHGILGAARQTAIAQAIGCTEAP